MVDGTLDDFETAVNEVLGEEAGYVNNVADPGGETKWGISKRAFPSVDIANLSRDDAKALYLAHYWEPLAPFNLSGLYKKVAFEAAVNQGFSRVKPWLVAAEGQLDWSVAYGGASLSVRSAPDVLHVRQGMAPAFVQGNDLGCPSNSPP